MPKTLKEIAALVDGQISGDPSLKIKGAFTFEAAGEGDLVFVLEDKNLSSALKSKASAVVMGRHLKTGKKAAILVAHPRLALARILKLFVRPLELEPGVHKLAFVHKTAQLGKGVAVGPFAYIGPKVKIGDHTIIHPQVTIYENVKIGRRCIIHAGARIGMDGYGFVPAGEVFEKIPQLGGVLIGDDVEIYCNTCIARGTLGNTLIGSGTKIDNLTHVAHNCEIGENCAITSLVGFAGSVKVGKHVSVAGQAGFSGHITIGENSVIMARSGVTKDIPPHAVVSGFPAQKHSDEMKYQAALRRLTKRT